MSDAVCANIGPRQQQRRLIGAFLFLSVTLAVGVSVMVFNAPRPWRLLVFLPAWASAIGFFQVSAKTCVALAARGLRNMDDGDEEVSNPSELEAIRAQSRGVHIRSIVVAAAVAAALAALP